MTKFGGWEEVRATLRSKLGAPAYAAWFSTLEAEVESDSLVIRCPDRFTRDWIRAHYGDAIAESAPGLEVGYRVEPEVARPPLDTEAAPRAAELGAANESLDPFGAFCVDSGNALAHEAARAVAGRSAGRLCPLFLSGGPGVGKTHLCRAIESHLRPEVVYRSSEEFTSEVTHAMRNGRMHEIRHRYRRALNVLILEDVQFLTGKRATQVELFHTLDHLIGRGKTIVLSADRAPSEIEGLDPNLRSRMASGLVACISPPMLETRLRILREKAAGGGIRLPEECLEILAGRPAQSIRDLLGGLNQVVARASLMRRPITRELVGEALAAVDVPGSPHTLEQIRSLVARCYGVTEEELRSRSRRRRIVKPRQFAMYLARRYTEASLAEIGRAFGRDHSSVIYAIDVVERRIVERPQLRYELESLASRFSPSPPQPSPPRSARGRTRGTRPT